MKNSYLSWLEFLDHGLYKEYNPFLRFAILWLSFNAYLNERYASEGFGDFKKVQKFATDKRSIEVYQKFAQKRDMINDFSQTLSDGREFVTNLKIAQNSEKVYFNEKISNCKDYFDVLYIIRCNFFHGDKVPSHPNDQKLIEWAYEYLYDFLNIYWNKDVKINK